ncbi:MAG: c-type cytochrome [Verrucomicrobiae bacterium]|nr:c-type cytochrome [Verrucomicrobiae bacterium]
MNPQINIRRVIGLLLILSLCVAQAAGRQLTGGHAPASSAPIPPENAASTFSVPEGFEMRLFAAEPDVVNPVAMDWDERGRLWVLELFEYPLGAKRGEKPRDRIRILEDTDADGRADKSTLFADGLNLATGLLLGNGGVYVGQAPYLLFLEDTNGDDRADKRTTLLGGFGLEDRHELLNGFAWGPDGWLYMTQGVFTHSKVKDPEHPERPEVIMNAAVGRFHPDTKAFEVFADGASNQWHVDFDRFGNAFVSACVIDHLFHMAPGGLYTRQAGRPEHAYSYELLPSIVDHKHYRAAYCGISIYQGNQYPQSYQGRVLMGNIHENAVNMDRLERDGSSFKAHALDNFVESTDGWFRAVSEQIGPDGTVWIADWYDKYPCYQNANADPEGVDRQYGRIWRVAYVGDQPDKPLPSRPAVNMNLALKSSQDLIGLLAHSNVWHRETAQRLLNERKDNHTQKHLVKLMETGDSIESRLTALWTLHGAGLLDESILKKAEEDGHFAIRSWAARLTGERRSSDPAALARLQRLAEDRHPSVRNAVATALRQYSSGALTVNRPSRVNLSLSDLGPIFASLIQASAAEEDPLIPFMTWMALEPWVTDAPQIILSWLVSNGESTKPLSQKMLYKTMRRLCDQADAGGMSVAAEALSDLLSGDRELLLSGLDGLIDGQKLTKTLPAGKGKALLVELSKATDPSLRRRYWQLGSLWGDDATVEQLAGIISNPSTKNDELELAIGLARQINHPEIINALLFRIESGAQADMVNDAIEALGTHQDARVPDLLINLWPEFAMAQKQISIAVMVSRPTWLNAFLSAVESRKILPADVPASVIRSLANHRNDDIKARAQKSIGRFREPNASMDRLIDEKRQVVLEGEPDPVNGRQLTEMVCLVCHQLHGKGANVGPDLTGVGRSTLDALLANVINPNQLIGAGYENTVIETKDERSVSGRLVEETDSYVKLLAAGPREEVISKSDIQTRAITENSVMPEGLEQMGDKDFRDMIWFILNPPEDQRPLTAALRRELVGEAPDSVQRDYESISLWNPDWQVESSEKGNAPTIEPDWEDAKNVLVTHPFWHQRGAALLRKVNIPAQGKTFLRFKVASAPEGQWVLRVFADLKLVQRQSVSRQKGVWNMVEIDLTPFAGKEIPVRLENYAYDMKNDFGYWGAVKLITK